MLKTYYCPRCQHIRQFFIEHGEKLPTICGHLAQAPFKVFFDEPPSAIWEVCRGTLLPVANVDHIVVGSEGAKYA